MAHGFDRSANGRRVRTVDHPDGAFTQVSDINERGQLAGSYDLPPDDAPNPSPDQAGRADMATDAMAVPAPAMEMAESPAG